jgi:hypothetical protein
MVEQRLLAYKKEVKSWSRIFLKFPPAGLGPQYVRVGTWFGPETIRLPSVGGTLLRGLA